MNLIADSDGQDDRVTATKAVSSGFFVLCSISALLLGLFYASYPFIPFQSLFHLSSTAASLDSSRAAAVFIICFVVSLPLSIVHRVQAGYQEGFVSQLWQSTGNVLGLVGVLVAIKLRGQLCQLAIGLAAMPLLALVANYAIQFRFKRAWLLPRWKYFDLNLSRSILQSSIYFFVLQLATVAVFSIDSLIAIHILGHTATAEYNVVQKLFQVGPILVGVCSAPLWPAYAEALSRRDLVWVRKTLRRSVELSAAISSMISLCLLAFLSPILSIWVGPRFHPSRWLTVGFALSAVLVTSTSAVASYLNGSNFLQGQVVLVLLQSAAGIFLKLYLGKQFGSAGIIWGTVIPYCLLILPAYLWIVPRLLKTQRNTNYSTHTQFAIRPAT